MIFTLQERTVKKHTVQQAINQAHSYLHHTHRINKVCTDMVRYRSLDEQITVAEMSKIVEDVVFDTIYWERGM